MKNTFTSGNHSFFFQLVLICFGVFILTPNFTKAQVEGVRVEKYYVSDSLDATDTTGGYLEPGSVTYRVYIDLKAGSTLKKIYGAPNHSLIISSTQSFFNNKVDGQSFGKEFSKTRLGENTVALDSWLTLGQTTRIASKTNFGVPKVEDRDGSFIGGAHNDGGSAEVPGGLLVNDAPEAGIPLTTSDGMDTMTMIPGSWADYGIIDQNSGEDSTIFGSVKTGNSFVSDNAGLQNSGVSGVNPDSNLVLVAQLTTKGDLSFELNVEVEEPAMPNPLVVKYVAQMAPGDVNSDTLKFSPFLKYPASCGCMDPNYLEYDAQFTCGNRDSCKTHIVYGCMDTVACNFNSEANFHIQALCCYPGNCNDRDLGIVCPSLTIEKIKPVSVHLFPNPVQDQLTLHIVSSQEESAVFMIYNSIGELIYTKEMGIVSGSILQSVEVSALSTGMYMLRYNQGTYSATELFFKK